MHDSPAQSIALSRLYTRFTALATSSTTHRAIIGTVATVALLIFTLVFSLVSYAGFYHIYIPELSISTPVWLQYGYGKVPYAQVKLPQFAQDQQYDVSLELRVPQNKRNLDLGNFMVRLDLFKSQSQVHDVTISRPATLTHVDPGLLRISLSPNSKTKAQHLRVPLLQQTVLRGGRKNRAGYTNASVYVGREDATKITWNDGQKMGELQVYEARLLFEASFTSLRWLMYHHSILSFFAFTSLFFIAAAISSAVGLGLVLYRNSSRRPEIKSEPLEDFKRPSEIEKAWEREAQSGVPTRLRLGLEGDSESEGDYSLIGKTPPEEEVPVDIKQEFDDNMTIGGSESSRPTVSTFRTFNSRTTDASTLSSGVSSALADRTAPIQRPRPTSAYVESATPTDIQSENDENE